MFLGNSLAVQWLGLGPLTARGPGSIPGRGTKILQATQCGQYTLIIYIYTHLYTYIYINVSKGDGQQ